MLSTTVWKQIPDPDPSNPYTRTRFATTFTPSGFATASWIPISSEGILDQADGPSGVIAADGLSGISETSAIPYLAVGIVAGALATYVLKSGILNRG